MREQEEQIEDRNEMIFGMHPIMEAIRSGKDIEKIFLQEGLTGPLSGELKQLLKEFNVPFQYVPIMKLDRFTRKNHQGVVGFVSPITFYSIEELLPQIFEKGEMPFIVVLDRITDVRNFGAIVRTAACAGAHAIIIPQRGSASVNGVAVKTSAGALHTLPICREKNLKESLDYLKDSGLQIVSCTEKATDFYSDVDLSGPSAFIFGSEEDGISPEYLKKSDHRIKIPMVGEIASLNVSVATGIVLFEAVRQRK